MVSNTYTKSWFRGSAELCMGNHSNPNGPDWNLKSFFIMPLSTLSPPMGKILATGSALSCHLESVLYTAAHSRICALHIQRTPMVEYIYRLYTSSPSKEIYARNAGGSENNPNTQNTKKLCCTISFKATFALIGQSTATKLLAFFYCALCSNRELEFWQVCGLEKRTLWYVSFH